MLVPAEDTYRHSKLFIIQRLGGIAKLGEKGGPRDLPKPVALCSPSLVVDLARARRSARSCPRSQDPPSNLPQRYTGEMSTARYVHWQDQGMWLGYFEEFPDYLTQGETIEDLQENLRDLYKDLTSGEIPGIRRVAELPVG